MPIFDQGYRHWEGTLSGHVWRWLAIARRGILAQRRNRWVNVAVMSAWLPALVLAGVLVLWGLYEQKASFLGPVFTMVNEVLPPLVRAEPEQFRSMIWTFSYQIFFRIESFFAMVLVVLVGPGLISQDLRFNAIPLYLSRPMRRWDYFLGKLGVIGGFLAATMIGPPVLAWVLGVGFSLDFGVLRETLPLLGASVAYGSVLVVSAGALMLAISSLSKNSRHVVILWLGLWWVSNMLAGTLSLVLDKDWCPLVSYTSNLDRICHEMLGTEKAWKQMGKLVGVENTPRPTPPGMPPRLARRMQRPPWLLAEEHPWHWSAAALLGWLGLSIWILSLRVKTLDKLK